MRKYITILLTVFISMTMFIFVSCGSDEKQETQTETKTESLSANLPDSIIDKLTGVEKQLVEKFLMELNKLNVVTSLDQTATIYNLEVTDSMRIELQQFFLDNMTIHKKMQNHHPYTFILTNEEKLIAHYIVKYEKSNREFPEVKKISDHLGIPIEKIQDRMKFLAKLQLLFDLEGPDEYNALGFSFGAKKEAFTYELGLMYHIFYVEDQLPYNVGCGIEGIRKYLTELRDKHVRYETIDPENMIPVEVTFENGEIVNLKPEGAYFLEGRFCGSNNLFIDEESATNWVSGIPHVTNPIIQPVETYFKQIVARYDSTVTATKR